MLLGAYNLNIFHLFGNFIMVLGRDEALAISFTLNGCTILYCTCLKIQKCLSQKCCCGSNNLILTTCQVYNSKPYILAKMITEQCMQWIVTFLAVYGICASNVLVAPFSAYAESTNRTYLSVILGINTGRYIYMVLQDIFLKEHLEKSRFKTTLVHHLVAIGSYFVFLVLEQNLLLALIGMTMEVNLTVVEIAKVAKELGKSSSVIYKNLTIFTCVLTILFRGVLPVAFLIIAMLQQSPFIMHYVTLTAFFLSIIFFSVINVWLILGTIQRCYKLYHKKETSCYQLEECRRSSNEARGISTNINDYTKNNLGYLRSYDNRNLANNENEKLNTAKKEFPKDNLAPQYTVRNNLSRDSNNSSGSTSTDSIMDEPSPPHAVSADVHVVRPEVRYMGDNSPDLRDSNGSNNSSTRAFIVQTDSIPRLSNVVLNVETSRSNQSIDESNQV